jgi:hypothetical protein
MWVTEAFGPWLALRFAAGVASALVLVGISARALGTLSAARKTQWTGVVFAGVGIGIAGTGAFVLLGGVRGVSSAHMWLALGIASAVVAAATWRSLRPIAGEAKPATGRRSPFTSDARRLIACYGTFGFGYIVPATYIHACQASNRRSGGVGMVWPAFGSRGCGLHALGLLRVSRFCARRLWLGCQLVMRPALPLAAFGRFRGARRCRNRDRRHVHGGDDGRNAGGAPDRGRCGDAADGGDDGRVRVGQLAGPIVVALLAGTASLSRRGHHGGGRPSRGRSRLVRNSTASKEIRHG